eukprot:500712-Amphidinium_carterae.1
MRQIIVAYCDPKDLRDGSADRSKGPCIGIWLLGSKSCEVGTLVDPFLIVMVWVRGTAHATTVDVRGMDSLYTLLTQFSPVPGRDLVLSRGRGPFDLMLKVQRNFLALAGNNPSEPPPLALWRRFSDYKVLVRKL